MTNSGNLGTIEATNPVLTVVPLKEDTEMLRATEKITALYCHLSVEDMKDDKNGGKGDVSNSIKNQKDILLRYAKEHRFPNPTFFVDDGYSGTNYDRPRFQQMLSEIEAGKAAVVLEELVWMHVKTVISYVTRHEAHFQTVMEYRLRLYSEEAVRGHKKRLVQAERRLGELDRLFIRIYEDNVAGKLSDERFALMSKTYEDE